MDEKNGEDTTIIMKYINAALNDDWDAIKGSKQAYLEDLQETIVSEWRKTWPGGVIPVYARDGDTLTTLVGMVYTTPGVSCFSQKQVACMFDLLNSGA